MNVIVTFCKTVKHIFSKDVEKLFICSIIIMHGETLKFVNAQQAKPYNIYKNTKLNLLKTNAVIWFNKICRDRQLQPRYINIKIKGRKQQDKKTVANAIRFRMNQKIKFHYKRKQHFNQQLYQDHLKCAHHYYGTWQHIQTIIDRQLKQIKCTVKH